jgi:hypothetical protein
MESGTGSMTVFTRVFIVLYVMDLVDTGEREEAWEG